MATTDFEARQLLKAYRKGLISDELFEEQMQELQNGTTSQGYSYSGKSYETEKSWSWPSWTSFGAARILPPNT